MVSGRLGRMLGGRVREDKFEDGSRVFDVLQEINVSGERVI